MTHHGEANIVHWNTTKLSLFLGAFAGLASAACQSGGVGDPCVPEDEYFASFPGYTATQVNVESKSFQCETRACLVANFQGRVSCPYGQTDTRGTNGSCTIPGSGKPGNAGAIPVTVPVAAQLTARLTNDAVYCSCRCAGADTNAKYCDCPNGFVCAQNLVPAVSDSQKELAGSYCIKSGTQVQNPNSIPSNPCSLTTMNCGAQFPDNL